MSWFMLVAVPTREIARTHIGPLARVDTKNSAPRRGTASAAAHAVCDRLLARKYLQRSTYTDSDQAVQAGWRLLMLRLGCRIASKRRSRAPQDERVLRTLSSSVNWRAPSRSAAACCIMIVMAVAVTAVRRAIHAASRLNCRTHSRCGRHETADGASYARRGAWP